MISLALTNPANRALQCSVNVSIWLRLKSASDMRSATREWDEMGIKDPFRRPRAQARYKYAKDRTGGRRVRLSKYS